MRPIHMKPHEHDVLAHRPTHPQATYNRPSWLARLWHWITTERQYP